MARRRSSARRRRAAGAGPAASGSPTPRGSAAARARAAQTGTISIRCPQCGQGFRIGHEHMNEKVTCTQCGRHFFPKAASGRGLRKKNEAGPYLLIGFGLIAVIVIGVIIANSGRDERPVREVARSRSVNIGWSNERVQDVVAWARAIPGDNDFEVSIRSDFAALQRQLGVDSERPFDELVGEQRAALEERILAALKGDEKSSVFRDFQPAEARLKAQAMASSDTGEVDMLLTPRDTEKYHELAEAHVDVRFRWEDEHAKVTGWEIVKVDKPRRPKRPRYERHEKIATPTKKERVFGGKKITVLESEPVPLEHLPDTPEPLRKEIDALIADLLDLNASGITANRARFRLQKIGKPAVPRLLTKFYEIRPNSREDVLALTRVVHTLRDLTGVSFGYNPADRGVVGIGATTEERESALKQWYGWWWKYAHRPDWQYAIQKGEGEELFRTDEDKKEAREATANKKQDD